MKKPIESLKNFNNIIITSFMGIGNTINLIPLAEYFKKQNKKVVFLVWNRGAGEIIQNNKFIYKIIMIPTKKSIIQNLLFTLNLKKKINPKKTLFIVSYPHGPRREKFISKIYNAKKTIFINRKKQAHDVITNIYKFNKNIKYKRPIIFFSKKEKNFKENFLKQNKISKKDFVIGIHPGCNPQNIKKRLPKKEYIKIIINQVKTQNKIFLFLGPDELNMDSFFRERLKEHLYKEVFIINEKLLRNSAVLMSRCNKYLGNDSGLMHVAEAVGVKDIKAFFLTNLEIAFRNYPLGKKENAILDVQEFLKKFSK